MYISGGEITLTSALANETTAMLCSAMCSSNSPTRGGEASRGSEPADTPSVNNTASFWPFGDQRGSSRYPERDHQVTLPRNMGMPNLRRLVSPFELSQSIGELTR